MTWRYRAYHLIHDNLFKKSEEANQIVLTNIIKRNSELNNNKQGCFKYKGEIYFIPEALIVPQHCMNELDKSLLPEFLNYKENIKFLEGKKKLTEQMLKSLLINITNLDQLIEVVPLELVPIFKVDNGVVDFSEYKPIDVAYLKNTYHKYFEELKELQVWNILL